jgi:hypothetical protein
MSDKKYVRKDRVALAENIMYRGHIVEVYPGYPPAEPPMYTVQWDKSGSYLYLGAALIPEKEAENKLAAEWKEHAKQEKSDKPSIGKTIKDKFKALLNSDKELKTMEKKDNDIQYGK